MMRIATIVGARPQFIKAAVVSRAIVLHHNEHPEDIEEVIVHTGQHFDKNMSEVFFEELSIPEPHFNLCINSAGHGEMTGKMMAAIEQVLTEKKPDWVLVYGDTNSTLAGTLAAKKMNIKLAHVEAGLRSYNMRMPEEQNRLVADRFADLLFCPTANAVANLERENIGASPYGERVLNVGDVMYDAAMFYADRTEMDNSLLARLRLNPGEFMLATVHRAENTDDPVRLRGIFSALQEIAVQFPVVVPIHPRTAKSLNRHCITTSGIHLIDPVSYLDMVLLEKHCKAVLTDSGGVQKEAFFFAKPCLTLRNETEWTELVDAGVNFLVGADHQRITECLRQLADTVMDFSPRPYGDGSAGGQIVKAIINRGDQWVGS